MGIKAVSILAAGLALAALPGCTNTPAKPIASANALNDFTALYDRNFQSTAAAPEDYFIERRVRLDGPGLDGVWFYAQINKDADAKLYRQRVLNFTSATNGTIVQKAYRIHDPEALTDLWDKPAKIKALSLDDIEPYFDTGCDQIWARKTDNIWHGLVDPKTCIIDSKRRGKQIRIETESRLSADSYLTNERGYSMENEFLWGSKPGTFMTMKPVK